MLGKLLRHFRNICTIKPLWSERSDDSKLHPCIGCWWLLTATKIINQQNLNHSFWPLFEFRHFWKKILPPCFCLMENLIFCKFMIMSPGFEKGVQGFVVKLWHTMSEIDQNTSYSYKILRFGNFFRFQKVTKLYFRKWKNWYFYLQGALYSSLVGWANPQ